MPKIALMNKETGKLEEFEPVDAREIMSNPDSIYEPPKDKDKEAGGTPTDISVPQYQGADDEMQVGLSVDKYGRSNVVKASVGQVHVGAVGKPVYTAGGTLIEPRQVDADTLKAQANARAAALSGDPEKQALSRENPTGEAEAPARRRGRPPGSGSE